jgi:hypothetical protein
MKTTWTLALGIVWLAGGAAAPADDNGRPVPEPRPAKTEYHVSPDGAASHPGSASKPFGTIGRAVGVAQPGDTVVLHAGTYREAVELTRGGEPGKPIRIVAAPGERVVLSGADPLVLDWQRHAEHVFQAQTPVRVRQLFIDGELMIEARWPNMSLDRLWDRARWARARKGSRYGKMVDPELATTGIDWTGAVATLNVAHQFYTWTRTVKEHSIGSDTFEYARDLQGITHYADKTRPWEDDRYYLTGKLEALDAPGEWFYDQAAKTLYLWPPDGDDPSKRRIEAKTRHRGLVGRNIQHVELVGLHLFACNFSFEGCHHVKIDRCHLRYPNAVRRISDPEADAFDKAETTIIGDDNGVTRSSFAWGPTGALRIVGRRNLVEDCLMHDFCWDGSLRYPMLSVASRGKEPAEDRCRVRHCTLYHCGNAVVNYRGLPGHIIEYNHVHDGGLCCKDVALVYTGQPTCAGSIVRYNWVHGCYTESLIKREGGVVRGGLGIRGDDQTRSLTVHHNVVWDCGRDGIIVKGDHNRVYNNTVFNIGSPQTPGNYINLHNTPEPEKWWRKQYPLLPVQNQNSQIANNVARTICGDNRGRPYRFRDNLSHNYTGDRPMLEDVERFRFWPREGSPLVDAGTHLPGFTDGYQGKAPDIGAYERGGQRWVPGIRWDPEQVLGDMPKGFLTIR